VERHVELGYLMDLYGALLTDRQRELLSQSVEEDCSLAEIAEREGISRQGVRDAIKRAEEQLAEYEQKLGLLKTRLALLEGLNELKNSVAQDTALAAKVARLTEICEDGI